MASGDGSEKSAWNKMPRRISQKEVLGTMGEEEPGFRDPFRLHDMDKWPNGPRSKDYEKPLGSIMSEWSKKGRPI